jgi:hypothetical protein
MPPQHCDRPDPADEIKDGKPPQQHQTAQPLITISILIIQEKFEVIAATVTTLCATAKSNRKRVNPIRSFKHFAPTHKEVAQGIGDIRFADEACQPGSDLAEPRPLEVPITDTAARRIAAADD